MQDQGSRMSGYLIPGVFASILLWTVAFLFLGPQGAWAVSVIACATGLVWILKKRQEDAEADGR